MPRIVSITPTSIAETVKRLRAGEVIAFPTETVYGLGADTFSVRALERVYSLKGRPFDNPLIAHVTDAQQARAITSQWPAPCDELAGRFWPGPLTLVLPKAMSVPDRATAGLATIAVRAPAHPAAQRLLETFGGPISAPSANRSGHVSPTTPQHVAADFIDVDDLLILDGGPSQVGIESTVLDMTASKPRILRPGAVTVEELRAVIGEIETPTVSQQTASPGTSAAHYAPRTPAEMLGSSRLQARLLELHEPAAVLCFDAGRVPPPHRAVAMPLDAAQYAAMLYSALRQADELGCRRILIETPLATGDLWQAIKDRLVRATQRS